MLNFSYKFTLYDTTNHLRKSRFFRHFSNLFLEKIVINNYYNDTMPVSPALVYQSKFSQGINQFQIDGEEFGYSERILRDLEQ